MILHNLQTRNMKLLFLLFLTPALARVLNESSQSRIIGGKNARDGQFPYMASIIAITNGYDIPFCGGSIISEVSILTSGICGLICEKPGYNCEVWVGSVNQFQGQKLKISKIITHETMDPSASTTQVIDLSIFRVSSKISISKTVKVAKLPKQDLQDHESTTILGWGSGAIPYPYNVLQHGATGAKQYNPDEAVGKYAETESDTVMACFFDSGGPLISNDLDELIGVVSFFVLQVDP
ncbi:collagenase-like [Sitodiplosis mosellana]|uniref:collagenase-like n=1 Tax=Sitodiplosis mosellana TaxID=263140 RepID=UPI002444303C|nr:collagenase-like [Sitodiplosis mosellana]